MALTGPVAGRDRPLAHQRAFFTAMRGRYADGYAISTGFLQRVRDAVSPFVRGDTLDIGNGGLLGLDPRRADTVTIADLCPDALRDVKEVADGRVVSVGPDLARRLRGIGANVLSLPFAPASFDVVVMGYVAHHLSEASRATSRDNVAHALAEVRRVLRPGGSFVMIENCPTRVCKLTYELAYPLAYRLMLRLGKPLPYFLSATQIEAALAAAQLRVTHRQGIAWDARVHQPLFPRWAPPGWLWERLLPNQLFVAQPSRSS
ncbi:MAG: class I SAM-dependent methyltransferase [Planctomycetota bacterium]